MSRKIIVTNKNHRLVLGKERINTLDEIGLFFEAHGIPDNEWDMSHGDKGGMHFKFYTTCSRGFITDIVDSLEKKVDSSIHVSFEIHRMRGLFREAVKEIKSFVEYGNNYIESNKL